MRISIADLRVVSPLSHASRSCDAPLPAPSKFGGKLRLLGVIACACACLGTAAAQTVLLGGLNNPRGLAVGPDGSLYFSEAGVPFTPDATTPSIATPMGSLYYGTGGAITRWSGGTATQLASNLPEIFNPANGDVLGAHGLAVTNSGDVYFSLGLGANPDLRAGTPFENMGQLMWLSGGGGAPVAVADLSAFESANNPAGGPLDSNPFGIALSPTGVYVADAGANALLHVSGGTVSLVQTFPPLFSGADAVPTAIAVGPDGTAYASQLTGFPFAPGSASVFRVSESELTPLQTGFTNVTDMEMGPDGMLYLLELSHNGLLSGDLTGGLWRVDPLTGDSTLLMTEGLFAPTALAIGGDGTIYVTNRGLMPGQGSLIAIAPIPEPATYGLIGALALGLLVWRRRAKAARPRSRLVT